MPRSLQTAVRSARQELTLRERVLLNFHLAVCPPCRRYRKQLAFLRENLKKWLSDKYS